MILVPDVPKSLRSEAARQARAEKLDDIHVEPLKRFVIDLRRQYPNVQIPHFDPLDGGINAKVLFLLEAPGAKAVASGFVSRNNPDETAKNIFELGNEAGLKRSETILWNAVPWYVGSGRKIRPATLGDLKEAFPALEELLQNLKNLKSVAFMGRKSALLAPLIAEVRSDLRQFECPHPSPLFCNRSPGNREIIASVLREVREFLDA